MAYQQSKTSALQTAVKGAVDIAVCLMNNGVISTQDEFDNILGEYQDKFTAALYPMVDADNVALNGSSGGSRRSSGGGSSSGTFSTDDAINTTLNFGSFQGLTLGAVYHLTAQEASAYSASVGKAYSKSGQDWLRWVAADKDPKRKFIRERAQAVLDNPPALTP